MEYVFLGVFALIFAAACGSAGKYPTARIPVRSMASGEPEEPLIEQLLKELKAQSQRGHDRCPTCNCALLHIERLCDMHLEAQAFICKTCLKGKTTNDDVFRPCHKALQDAIDATRKRYLDELRKEQKRLGEAQVAKEDPTTARLFPDHQAKLEANYAEVQAAVARAQRWVNGLAPNIVETVAARLAQEWRTRRRGPVPEGDGPYRTPTTP